MLMQVGLCKGDVCTHLGALIPHRAVYFWYSGRCALRASLQKQPGDAQPGNEACRPVKRHIWDYLSLGAR